MPAFGAIVTPVTRIPTEICNVAIFTPAIALIMVLPPPSPVTSPVELTVATEGLSEVHIIVLCVALLGDTVAVNEVVAPIARELIV